MRTSDPYKTVVKSKIESYIKVGIGDLSKGKHMCRCTGVELTINRFQPEGWPRKFLLQLCGVSTSNCLPFFSKLFEYYGKT